MSYPTTLRHRALEYWADGHTRKETAAVFKVSPSTLSEWKSMLKEHCTLEPQKRKTTWRKIDPAELERVLQECPDAYLKELAKKFSCSDVAISKACKRLKITRKKNHNISRSR